MSSAKPPWKRKRPDQPVVHLTEEEIAQARKRARRAGRRYPNLVDNMAIARRKKAKKSTRATQPTRRTRTSKSKTD